MNPPAQSPTAAPPAAAPAITAAALQDALARQLAPTFLQVLDESHQHSGHAGANGTGFGTHFRVRIAAPALDGLPRVAAHRLVYEALSGFLQQGLHALAIEIGPPRS